MLHRHFIAIGMTIAAAVLAAVQPADGFELPAVQQGRNLADCTAKLDRSGGGWCEIGAAGGHASIAAVWPSDLDNKTHMVVGPSSVLRAWNGGAIDEARGLLYFMGGGHTDYGGNEVYEFDLNSGQWARLTDPSPLSHLLRVRTAASGQSARYCWTPDLEKVPGSTHTYDGVQFSKKTGTIFLVVMAAANGSCFNDPDGSYAEDPRTLRMAGGGRGIYEFNPDRSEARNGLGPLQWRRVFDARRVNLSYPRSLERPDGSLLVGDRATLHTFDPLSGELGPLVQQMPRIGDGTAVYHPSGAILSLHQRFLAVMTPDNPVIRRIEVPQIHGKALAVNKDGLLFAWNGSDKILTLDLKQVAQGWRLFNWAGAGPMQGGGRVYSKWHYLAEQDVFVGVSTHRTGVWVYKHPAAMPESRFQTENLQKLIARAEPGSTVTVPPGTYFQGLIIDKSLTVKLKDVTLQGVAKAKGIINVNCNGCSVVIEDFHGEGQVAGCLGGNCAGIKAEGIDFNLTVRRADIDNTVMGILTDNRGGRLVVEDSTIENIGLDDHSSEVAHGLYAGLIDEVVLRNTTIRNVNGDGHLFKSRARRNVLQHTRLLGEAGYHSRSLDIPCGGYLEVSDSVIQHSENTDNPDVIAIGLEPRNCDEIRPSAVSMTDNWIIVDRDRSADERARTYGPNYLFRWRAPLQSLVLQRNHIVNIERWSTTETARGDVALSAPGADNVLCESRSACGLSRQGPPAD